MSVQSRTRRTTAKPRHTGLDRLLLQASRWARARKRAILLVDDDAAMRDLVREHLERANYQVFEAEDGTQALSVCSDYARLIDLLLTDI